MRRVVFDVGVIISGLLSAEGPPGRLLDQWRDDGAFDLIVSPLWLAELASVLERPKISRYLEPGDAEELLASIRLQAELADDGPAQPGLTPDPGDDYLVSLARAAGAGFLISGDAHLTGLEDAAPPVLTPRQFEELLGPAD
jgi:putative PIN family toxin of toxin-antitoxin system